jgi:hypothetical protein
LIRTKFLPFPFHLPITSDLNCTAKHGQLRIDGGAPWR